MVLDDEEEVRLNGYGDNPELLQMPLYTARNLSLGMDHTVVSGHDLE